MTETKPTRLKALRPEASRIFKLCLDKDRRTALQGLELAAALGQPLEGVLDEVSLEPESGALVRGKRFTGNDKTQPMLDALLVQQLGMAKKGTPAFALRNAVRQLSCLAPVLPSLGAFPALEEAVLRLTPDFQGEDVAALGKLPKLRTLEFSTGLIMYGQPRPTLKTLKGLQAPAMEDLTADYMGLEDVSALAHCKKLVRVDLRGNIAIADISGLQPSASTLEAVNLELCRAITSLKPLRQAGQLQRLDISGLEKIEDLNDLQKLTRLQALDISGCEGLRSLQGIPLQVLANPMRAAGDKPIDYLYLNGMKSLVSLAGMPPLSPEVSEFSINKALALQDLSGLEASAGSLRKLKISEAQIAHLDVLASLVHLEELEINACPNLVDASALGTLEKLRKVVLKGCKKLETLPPAWKSQVQVLSLAGCTALKPIKALPPGIDTKAIEIPDRRLLPRAKPVKALKSDVGSVWKLLSSRDVANIQMGLELSSAVEDGFDALFDGVKVQGGKLVRGKRFTGTGPAQPYLDIALFGLMQRARAGSPLAQMPGQVTELDLSLTTVSPSLQGMTRLKALTLQVLEDTTPDLSHFGPMPALETLTLKGQRWNSPGALLSLKGLVAPQLKNVELRAIGIQDLSALSNSPAISHLDLDGNETLPALTGLQACAPQLEELNLRECKALASLDVLAGATRLRKLDLYQCSGLVSLEPLAGCKSLRSLVVEGCSALGSLQGIESLPLQCEPGYLKTTEFSLDGCSSLTSLAHFPPLGDQIDGLSLHFTRALKDFKGLRPLPALKTLNARGSGLVDLREIGAMPALQAIDLSGCADLKDATPLGTLAKLAQVELDDAPVQHMPQAWQGPVTHLSLKHCNDLTSLGQLPEQLTHLVCDGSGALRRLDGMQACTRLEVISVQACGALEDLGEPPASVQKVLAIDSRSLRSLRGLKACTALEQVAIPLTVTDLSDLSGLATVHVNLNVSEATEELGGKKKASDPDPLATLPPALIKAINGLASVNLHAKGPSGSWYSKANFDLAVFKQFKNLQTLSFAEYDFSCEVEALAWLVDIRNLLGLWFSPRGNLSYKLGSSVYDSPKKVRALQLKICEAAKIKPPAHLAD